jgi:hypothetical protein
VTPLDPGKLILRRKQSALSTELIRGQRCVRVQDGKRHFDGATGFIEVVGTRYHGESGDLRGAILR